MPKSNPLRPPLLRALPLPLLNAVFPAFRLLCQLWWLLTHHLQLLLPRRQPPQQSRAVGRLVHIGYSWTGLPKVSKERAFATPLGLLGDRCRSAWVASWGGHGGVDKAGAAVNNRQEFTKGHWTPSDAHARTLWLWRHSVSL